MCFDASCERRAKVGQFIHWCNQPYVDKCDLTQSRANEIAHHYFQGIRQLTDDAVYRVLDLMRESITQQRSHSASADWKGCCTGVAQHLLTPSDLDGRDRVAVAGALQRLSGWYHTCIRLWSVFKKPATDIGDIICGKGVLHYLKIGEEWTFDQGRLNQAVIDNNGFTNLWEFAQGTTNGIRQEAKREDETRTLASRLLCFLCKQRYCVDVTESHYTYLVSQFPGNTTASLPSEKWLRDQHPLLRWAVGSNYVDMLTKRMVIHANRLLSFLEQKNFTPDVTYNPSGEARLAWFRTWNRLPLRPE